MKNLNIVIIIFILAASFQANAETQGKGKKGKGTVKTSTIKGDIKIDIYAGKERDAGFNEKIVRGQISRFIKTKLATRMLNIIINHMTNDIDNYEVRTRYNIMLLNDLIGDIQKKNYEILEKPCAKINEKEILQSADALAGRGDLYGPICFNTASMARSGFHPERIIGLAFHEYAHHSNIIDADHQLAAYFADVADLGNEKSPNNNLAQVKRMIRIQKGIKTLYTCYNDSPLFMAIILDNTNDLIELIATGEDFENVKCTTKSINTTPLMLATILGKLEAVKILIKSGVNINQLNGNDISAPSLIKFHDKESLIYKQLKYVFKKMAKSRKYEKIDFIKANSRDEASKAIYKQFRNGLKIKSVKFSRNRSKVTEKCSIVFYDKQLQEMISTEEKGWIKGHYLTNGMDRDGKLFGYYLKCGETKALLYLPPKTMYKPMGEFPFYGHLSTKDLKLKGNKLFAKMLGNKLSTFDKVSSSFLSIGRGLFGKGFKSHKYDREVYLTLRKDDFALLRIEAYINLGPIRDLYIIEFEPKALSLN